MIIVSRLGLKVLLNYAFPSSCCPFSLIPGLYQTHRLVICHWCVWKIRNLCVINVSVYRLMVVVGSLFDFWEVQVSHGNQSWTTRITTSQIWPWWGVTMYYETVDQCWMYFFGSFFIRFEQLFSAWSEMMPRDHHLSRFHWDIKSSSASHRTVCNHSYSASVFICVTA